MADGSIIDTVTEAELDSDQSYNGGAGSNTAAFEARLSQFT